MDEMLMPVFIPNYKMDRNIIKKNRNIVYEKYSQQEDISKHMEETKQLMDNLENEETKEIMRNKIFKRNKN